MKKKHKIVMLPTEDYSLLGVHNKKGLLYAKNEGWCYIVKHDYIQPQHLYILSDDEIKEGDWIYDGVINEVHKVFHDTSVIGQDRKIIATTDPKLIKELGYESIDLGKQVKYISLPQIAQSLVEYYVKHQTEYVELEYDGYTLPALSHIEETNHLIRLKLQNNEVVWVEPKVPLVSEFMIGQKLYTREELEGFAFHTAQNCQGMNDLEIEQWIKENL